MGLALWRWSVFKLYEAREKHGWSVRGIGSDHGDMYPNKLCPFNNCSETNTLFHPLLVESDTEPSLVHYEDVFSGRQHCIV